jgi:hypothetical protein
MANEVSKPPIATFAIGAPQHPRANCRPARELAHLRVAKIHAPAGGDRTSGMLDSTAKPQLSDIKPKAWAPFPNPFGAL